METIYEEKGEQAIKGTEWQPVEETWETMKVSESRTIDCTFQIKNNPFVKAAPTLRTFKVIERSNEKLLMRVVSKTRSVPYCDCFHVEEEWYVASMPHGNSSCCLRICYSVIWLQSTIMKSVISSNTASEQKKFWEAWVVWVKEKGLEF